MSGKRSQAAPFGTFKVILYAGLLLGSINFIAQMVRKPTEWLSLVSRVHRKGPEKTWRSYREYFIKAGTPDLPPAFLAALAHVESNGNPWASPPWKFRASTNLLSLYGPQSSAVGLFQFLNETFSEASQYCLNGTQVVPHFSARTPRSCFEARVWNSRLSAETSTHVAASYLNQEVRRILESTRSRVPVSKERKQSLAALVHLCGRGKALIFASSGYSWTSLGGCGPHDPQRYVQKVLSLRSTFESFEIFDRDRYVQSR